jgi:hypothetical protein
MISLAIFTANWRPSSGVFVIKVLLGTNCIKFSILFFFFISYSFGFSDFAPFLKWVLVSTFLFQIYKNLPITFSGLAKVAIFTTNVHAENQTLINHKCVCGALNRHFCQTRVLVAQLTKRSE